MRLILLSGLGRDQLHWQPLLSEIKAQFVNAEIETPDLPGTGIMYSQNSPLNIQDYIPYLEKQLQQSTQPAILIGLSLGSMIALKWAEMTPEKFSKIVLINSSSRLNYFFQRLNIAQVIAHPGIVFGSSCYKSEESIFHLTCNSRPADPQIIKRWTKIQEKHPVKLKNQLRQVIAGLTYRLPHKSKVPKVFVIYSKADRLVSPKCSQRLATYFDAPFFVNLWAGHDLPQDDPQWVTTKLVSIAKY